MKKIKDLIKNQILHFAYTLEHGKYPATVAEVLDENMEFPDAVHEAMKKFKESKPYRGSLKEIQDKFITLHHDLSVAYKLKEEPILLFLDKPACYIKLINLICFPRTSYGKYSVVIYLHEFGHALGKKEKATCKWSINLFRLYFPKQYAKLVPEGHLLMKKKETSNVIS